MFNALGNSLAGRNAPQDYLLSRYGGAAAAYSLQRLTTGVDNVVRARESVGDTEADFTSQEVSGGALREFALQNNSDLIAFADGGGTNDRMYFDGSNDSVSVTGITLTTSTGWRLDFTTYQTLTGATGFFGGDAENSGLFRWNSTTWNINDGTNDLSFGNIAIPNSEFVTLSVRCDGVNFYIYDITSGSDSLLGSVAVGSIATMTLDQLGASRNGRDMAGLLYDFKVSNTGNNTTWVAQWNGYGVDASDWEDAVGSNDGTVNGSPALFSGQGFDAFVTNLYDQSGSLGQPLTRFAQHATAADTRMYFDGSDDYVSVSGFSPGATDYFGACTISASVMVSALDGSSQHIWAMGAAQYSLSINASGNWAVTNTDTGVACSQIGEVITVSVDYNASGQATSLSVNGTEVWTGTSTPSGTRSDFYVGAAYGFGVGSFFNGVVYDLSLSGSSVTNFAFNGYGITDADWEDTVGSNDGTVNGSPAIYQGRNALQATAASQPQIVADGVVVTDANGNAATLFDGADDTLTMTGLTVSESTAFTVVDFDAAANDEGVYQIGTVNQVSSLFTEAGVLKARRQGGATDISATAPSSDTLYLFSHVAINDRAELWKNGATQGANESDVTLATSSTGFIGGLDANTYRMAATLTELVIYGADKTSDRAAIEASIAARYGITLS